VATRPCSLDLEQLAERRFVLLVERADGEDSEALAGGEVDFLAPLDHQASSRR
jgi:hypothetical protein